MYIFLYLHSQTQYSHRQGVYLLLLIRSNSILTSSRCIKQARLRSSWQSPSFLHESLYWLEKSEFSGPSVVIFQSFRIAKMAPSHGGGHASFDATFEMDSGDEWRIQSTKPQRSWHLRLRKHGHCQLRRWDTYDILDVVAPKKQWTEHLVEYPVIAFIDAANMNRLLNSTVNRDVTLVQWQQNIFILDYFYFGHVFILDIRFLSISVHDVVLCAVIVTYLYLCSRIYESVNRYMLYFVIMLLLFPQALLNVLRESHRTRMAFRKVGGFVYVMSVLVSMEGCLSDPPKSPWDQGTYCPVHCHGWTKFIIKRHCQYSATGNSPAAFYRLPWSL